MTNRWAPEAFRNEVLLYLTLRGFLTAEAAPSLRGMPVSERMTRDVGDVVGLPWALGVRNQTNLDLSGAMNEIESEAENAGKELFASIQKRKGHPAGDAYVTMPLSIFVKVMATLHPEVADYRLPSDAKEA